MLPAVGIIACSVYVIILCIFIVQFDCPVWGYLGHECHISSPYWFNICIILLLMLLLLMIQYQKKHDILINLWLTFSIILFISPNIALYLAGSGDIYFTITLLNIISLGFIPVLTATCAIRVPSLNFPTIVRRFFAPNFVLLLLLSLTVIFIASKQGYPSFFSLDDGIYLQRLSARKNEGEIVNYLALLTNNILFPLAFYISFHTRNLRLGIVSIISILFVFSYAAFRSFVVSSAVLFLFSFFNKESSVKSPNIVNVRGLGLALVAVICLLSITTVSIDSNPFSLTLGSLVTRNLVTPAIDNAKYIQYFENHHYFMLRDVNAIGPVMQWLTDGFAQGSLQDSKGFTLGSYYFSNTTNLNAPLWSSGYADFGLLGYLIYPSVVLFLYRLIQSRILLINRPEVLGLLYPYSVILILALNEASINGVMLGYGLLPVFVSVHLMSPRL